MQETLTLKDIKGRTCVVNPANVVTVERCGDAKAVFFVRFRSRMWIKIGAAESARLAKCRQAS